jgi:formate-dependent nitrite reductase membrane component NrfD
MSLGIGFLLSVPTFALLLTIHRFALFACFFALAAVFVTFYTGLSIAATQDVE